MQTRSRNTFTAIHTEGSLLPVDLLQRVLSGDKDLGGLAPADYHLPEGEKLNEAVNRSWNRLQGAWAAFQTSKSRLKEGDPGTTLTRERWLLPLFQEFGYGWLATAKSIEIEGKAYPISHGWANVPIHLVGCGIDLDRRAAGVTGASKSSPHSLVQELLNQADDRQWGIASNGMRLRILRDNASLTRQAFLEFDLEAMFAGEVYADFVLLWLFCHQSRFESGDGKTEGCWLEKWSKAAQERGTRALDQLRNGVEDAIKVLGSGFLALPANQGLRAQLRSGKLSTQDYYRQLLRLVYQLIFLFAAEDRDLLLDPQADTVARDRYLHYYSMAHLRWFAERQRGGRHADLWQGLRLVTDMLGGKEEGSSAGAGLGLPVLNGFLFSDQSLPDLEASQVDNQSLLNAIRSLAFTIEGSSRRAVDYKNLGPEELGSVYESLLELHPILNSEAGTFELTSASGHERKTTGSYYTPTSLIQVLLDSALDPVIEQAVKNAGASTEGQQSALLNLKVCDPACGSGHFLIAAAHRIADKLARVRSEGDEPSVEEKRKALREVIAHCIYGVDVNPMAVELCKVNLWLESIEPGKPLSFLDAHIQCGDSLVGVSPGLDIHEIPDEAFNPAFGDDKATASALKKRNKRERTGQLGFRWKVIELTSAEDLRRWRAERAGQVDAMPEDDPAQVQAKAQAFAEFQQTQEYIQNRLEYDLWTAAFFWPIPKADAEHMLAPTQQELVMLRSGGSPDAALADKVCLMAESLKFFHWELAFPQIFMGENPGFDCMLGNPPWEKIQAEEQAFFASRNTQIAVAAGVKRKRLIELLKKNNPELYLEFIQYKREIELTDGFIKTSDRYPLTGSGKMNTYAIFAELYFSMLSLKGHSGSILPLGIVADDNNKDFFAELIRSRRLVSVFGFENEEFLFRDIHHAFKFIALSIAGKDIKPSEMDFAFYCRQVINLSEKKRRYVLSLSDVVAMNPNTITLPIFRTSIDADLNKKIYSKFPVIINDPTGKNPWNVSIHRMVNPTDDSSLFKTKEDLICLGGKFIGNQYRVSEVVFVPIYEAKMIHKFDHRFGTYENQTEAQANQGKLPELNQHQHVKIDFLPMPRYWMEKKFAEEWISRHTRREWLFGFRDITSSVVLNTTISTVIPRTATVDPCRVIYFREDTNISVQLQSCFIGSFNSLVFDYLARQKISGSHLAIFILKQLPVVPPDAYAPADIDFIAPRVLELVYTAYDLKPFAEDMGYHGEPFRWDEERRALLRAELDAYYARLYGLTRDELRYILDPQDVYGPNFPGETFRVLKEKEIKHFGEYRTRRLVLEAWDRLEGVEIGNPNGYRGQDTDSKLAQPVITISQERKENKPASAPKVPARPALKEQIEEENPAQPSFTDFGLYKCEACGELSMGFDRENHAREEHAGKVVEWRRVK